MCTTAPRPVGSTTPRARSVRGMSSPSSRGCISSPRTTWCPRSCAGSVSGSRTTSGAPLRARSTSPPRSPATPTRWRPGWPPSAPPAHVCPAEAAWRRLPGGGCLAAAAWPRPSVAGLPDLDRPGGGGRRLGADLDPPFVPPPTDEPVGAHTGGVPVDLHREAGVPAAGEVQLGGVQRLATGGGDPQPVSVAEPPGALYLHVGGHGQRRHHRVWPPGGLRRRGRLRRWRSWWR